MAQSFTQSPQLRAAALWLLAVGFAFSPCQARFTLDVEGKRQVLYEASYALLVGAGKYQSWPGLDSVAEELDQVQDLLQAQGFTVVRRDDPDSRELKRAFEDFIYDYGYNREHRLLFFFAGHGHSFAGDPEGYLVPVDGPLPKDRLEFQRTAYTMTDIMAWARKMKAKHALFLFDSCFSGSIFQARNLPEPPRYITEAALQPVRQFITAGRANETVPARSDFTAEFIKALKYRLADNNEDGFVTGLELGNYLNGTVSRYGRQTPQYGKIADPRLNLGDFIFRVGQAKPLVIPGRNGTEPTRGVARDFSAQLKTCRRHFDANRLTTGAGGTALACYLAVLEQDPGNSEALSGLEQIEARYAGWIESALSKGDTVRAERYMASLRKVNPESPALPAAEERLRPVTEERGVIPARDNTPTGGTWTDPTTGMEFVKIPGGCFDMGSPDSEKDRADDEKQHRVCVEDFWMGKTEVTVGQFQKFTRATGYSGGKVAVEGGCKGFMQPAGFSQNDKHPVACVTWEDAQAYAEWLARQSDKGVRLPTEAEWEYAARAGTTTPFHTGNCIGTDQANYNGNYPYQDCPKGEYRGQTVEVGSFPANAFGLYDMHGNVWEWTCSGYDENYGEDEKSCKNNANLNVLRGGSWNYLARSLRAANRDRYVPGGRGNNIGFRLVFR